MLMLVQGFYLGQAFEFGITDGTFMIFKITDAYAVSNDVVDIVGIATKDEYNIYIFKIRMDTRGNVLEEKYIGPFGGGSTGVYGLSKVKRLPNGDWLFIGGDTIQDTSFPTYLPQMLVMRLNSDMDSIIWKKKYWYQRIGEYYPHGVHEFEVSDDGRRVVWMVNSGTVGIIMGIIDLTNGDLLKTYKIIKADTLWGYPVEQLGGGYAKPLSLNGSNLGILYASIVPFEGCSPIAYVVVSFKYLGDSLSLNWARAYLPYVDTPVCIRDTTLRGLWGFKYDIHVDEGQPRVISFNNPATIIDVPYDTLYTVIGRAYKGLLCARPVYVMKLSKQTGEVRFYRGFRTGLSVCGICPFQFQFFQVDAAQLLGNRGWVMIGYDGCPPESFGIGYLDGNLNNLRIIQENWIPYSNRLGFIKEVMINKYIGVAMYYRDFWDNKRGIISFISRSTINSPPGCYLRYDYTWDDTVKVIDTVISVRVDTILANVSDRSSDSLRYEAFRFEDLGGGCNPVGRGRSGVQGKDAVGICGEYKLYDISGREVKGIKGKGVYFAVFKDGRVKKIIKRR